MGRNRGAGAFIIIRIFAVITIIAAVVIGIGLGLSLAATINIKNQENFVEFAPALPTKLLDASGTVITEFSAEEKRELVSLSELPKHLIYAVLAREDPDFYKHRGFSLRGIARAVYGQVTGVRLGGGSTITQQVAGTLYTDRTEYSIQRKINELWWAFQMERRYTKNEILEIYLNYMIMGPGTYGVEAASKYFFGRSARDISLAESALLAIQLSSPARYNPLDNPNTAMRRQHAVLDRMIEFGYTTQEEAEASFDIYWANYDFTRESTSAFYHRSDSAPWFSEYVRRELDRLMYGTMDYYRDGYSVLTTLDLRQQQAAEKLMAAGLVKANEEFNRSKGSRLLQAENTYTPIVDLLSLYFDLSSIHATSDAQNERKAYSRYTKIVNPVVDMAALMFGIAELKIATNSAIAKLKDTTEKNTVEGALIAIENETGYIKALIGGSQFNQSNQLIRATQGSLQPGSTFKPLYYSAAIDTGNFTASTLIHDIPMVFYNENGVPYIPMNFRGEWKGTVLFYDALANSMNVPSLKVLDAIGFDAAIDRAAALLGITDSDDIRRTFPRVYPLGLGIISVSPLRMVKAFATFANEGREVTPIAIRAVEDRNGRVVLDPERELRLQQRRKGSGIQIVSQQNAYIMTSILKKTVESGTLYASSNYGAKFTFWDEKGNRFKMPAAGKTGTPQNWSDAWAIGYTPYMTAGVWFGFDKPGNSLGVNLTGATLAGPVWADFIREAHIGLPPKDFARPSTGLVDVTVCSKSGLLKTSACNSGDITLPFLEGTQPSRSCDVHQSNVAGGSGSPTGLRPLEFDTMAFNGEAILSQIKMPELNLDLLPGNPSEPNNASRNTANRNTTNANNRNRPAQNQSSSYRQPGQSQYGDGRDEYGIELPDYNPLLE